MFYYYVKWWCEGFGDDMPAGFYHASYRTSQNFQEFVESFVRLRELLIKTFDTEEELVEFEKSVGLAPKDIRDWVI